MSRGSWIIHPETGELIEKHLYRRPPPKRSAFPCPMLIRDFQEPVFSHADGKTYTSRKHWRDHLKAHGMVELGNEMPKGPAPTPAITEKDISEAYDQVKAGYHADLKQSPPEQWQGAIEESIDEY